MEALEAIYTRRSTRNYKPDTVEKEILTKILEAARQAPSGGNSQTNHFLVIQNREVLDKLIALTEAGFRKMEADETTYPSLRHAIEASKKGGYAFCYENETGALNEAISDLIGSAVEADIMGKTMEEDGWLLNFKTSHQDEYPLFCLISMNNKKCGT